LREHANARRLDCRT